VGLFKRILGPATPLFDRRVDWRIGQVVAPNYAPREDLERVSTELSTLSAELLSRTGELRRMLADDFDAANETAALIGRSLARLTDAVERLGERVEHLEKAVADSER
jgi:hypothetical protein